MATTAKRGRQKGTPKTGGRKKGSLNVITVEVKSAIQEAFVDLGAKKYLVALGREDPRTFCTLLGKIIPNEIAGSLDVNVKTHEEWLQELAED